MNCPKCGSPLRESSKFCPSCGEPVNVSAPPVSEKPVTESPAKPPVFKDTEALTLSPQKNFSNTYLGFVIAGVLFLAAIILGAVGSKHFFSGTNFVSMLINFVIYGCLACGIGITSSSKGADLSSYAVTAVTSSVIGILYAASGSLFAGILVAFLLCLVIGFANAFIASRTNLPMAFISLFVAQLWLMLFNAIFILISNGMPLQIGAIAPKTALAVWCTIFFLIAFAAAFVPCLVVKKFKTPFYLREKAGISFVYGFPYIISAVFAFFGGVLYILRTHSAFQPSAAADLTPVIFAAVFVLISRIGDKLSVPMALIGTFAYAVLNNALNIIGINAQRLIFALLVIILSIVTLFITRRKDIAFIIKTRKQTGF